MYLAYTPCICFAHADLAQPRVSIGNRGDGGE
jgi:hypothetical protein